MSASSPIVRIAASVFFGGASAAIGGAGLGYIYETLDDAPIIRLTGLDEFGSAVYFGLFGLVLGIVVGVARLGWFSATVVGFGLGLVFSVCWSSFVASVHRQPDRVMIVGAIPMLALVGFLTARFSRALSARSGLR